MLNIAVSVRKCAAIFVGLLLFLQPLAADTAELVRVQLKWYNSGQFAGFYAALAKGYYRDAGLDVQLLEGGRGINVPEVVADGRAEFGVEDPIKIIAHIDTGKAIIAISTIFQRNPQALISRKELNITKPSQLIDKTIRLLKPQEVAGLTILAQLGVRRDRFKIDRSASEIDNLKHSDVDVWFSYLTNMAAKADAAGIPINIIYPDDFRVHVPGDSIIVSKAYLGAKPNIGRRFVTATVKGWRFAAGHIDETVNIMQSYNMDYTKGSLTSNMKITGALLRGPDDQIGNINIENWQKIANTMFYLGFVSSKIDARRFIDDVLSD